MKIKIIAYTIAALVSTAYAETFHPVMPNAKPFVVDASSKIQPSSNVPWNFEFKNKDNIELFVTVQNGTRIAVYEHPVYAAKGSRESDYSYLRISGLNLALPIIVTVSTHYDAVQSFAINPTWKTIYVSYEGRSLRAQKGTGFFNKTTQSGLNLKNNITTKDITPLSKEAATKNWLELKQYKTQKTEKEIEEFKKRYTNSTYPYVNPKDLEISEVIS